MTLALTVLAVLAGLALGALYVAALLWNVRLYLAGPRDRAIALHVLRFTAIAAAVWFAGHHGAGALLALAAGFLAATWVAARAGVR